MQYKSLNKARVVHDKRNDKSRGFGFVSFLDPQDFIRALKEMNGMLTSSYEMHRDFSSNNIFFIVINHFLGKYVGNRPCKLVKSRWDDRSYEKYIEKQKKEDK